MEGSTTVLRNVLTSPNSVVEVVTIDVCLTDEYEVSYRVAVGNDEQESLMIFAMITILFVVRHMIVGWTCLNSRIFGLTYGRKVPLSFLNALSLTS